MLVDLSNLDLTGKDAEFALGQAGITVNKNSIPFETLSPMVTSGIRIGTPICYIAGHASGRDANYCRHDRLRSLNNPRIAM